MTAHLCVQGVMTAHLGVQGMMTEHLGYRGDDCTLVCAGGDD